jgi:hypothetical protein
MLKEKQKGNDKVVEEILTSAQERAKNKVISAFRVE